MNSAITSTAAADSNRKFGDFTGLAQNYSKFRPHYAESVRNALVALTNKPAEALVAADLGAGTGLWTRMLAQSGMRSVIAVEPNADMRSHGERDNGALKIAWRDGSGEATGLEPETYDLVTAASCFHWFDFQKGTQEICRILKPGGRFAALWNPRFIEVNPLLVEIERKILELAPHVKRVSSGHSEFTSQLFTKLQGSPLFKDVLYIEGRHTQFMSREQYMGAWRSVNDLQVQMGALAFEKFMAFIELKLSGVDAIEAVYQTRCWTAARR